MVIFKNEEELNAFGKEVYNKFTREYPKEYNTDIEDFPGLKELISTKEQFIDLFDYLDEHFKRWDLYDEIGRLSSIRDGSFKRAYGFSLTHTYIDYFKFTKWDINIDMFKRVFEAGDISEYGKILPDGLREIFTSILGLGTVINAYSEEDGIKYPICIPVASKNKLLNDCVRELVNYSYVPELEELIFKYIELHK